MAYNPGVSFFIPFHELDPKRQSQCIFFTLKGMRCRCSASDSQQAIQLHKEITANGSEDVSLDLLQEYIKCNCCMFGRARHRERIEDIGLLMPLAQRWQDEIYQTRESPLRYNLRSRNITVYQAQSSEFRLHVAAPTLSDTVSYKICEPLKDRDFEQGSLYMFDRDESPGHVKIGWTARSEVWTRLDDWSKCGYTPNLLFSVYGVPNAQRAETLTHHELLKEWRRERMCKAEWCRKSHQEWFEVGRDRAAQVLGDWAEVFKRVELYDYHGSLKQQWREVARVLDKKGEAVTAKRMLEYYEASLFGRATVVKKIVDSIPAPKIEEAVNLVPARRIEKAMDSEFTPKTEEVAGSGFALKIEEVVGSQDATTIEPVEALKKSLSNDSSARIEKPTSSIGTLFLESAQELPKHYSPAEASLPKEETQFSSNSLSESKPLSQTESNSRDESVSNLRFGFTSETTFKFEPLSESESPSKINTLPSTPFSFSAEPLSKTKSTFTAEPQSRSQFSFVHERPIKVEPLFKSKSVFETEPLLSTEFSLPIEPLPRTNSIFDTKSLSSTQLSLTLEPAVKAEPQVNKEPPIKIEPLPKAEPVFKTNSLAKSQPSILAEPLSKTESIFNMKPLPSTEFSFAGESPARNEQPVKTQQPESLFNINPPSSTPLNFEPEAKADSLFKTTSWSGAMLKFESLSKTDSVFKTTPLSSTPLKSEQVSKDQSYFKTTSSSTPYKFEPLGKSDLLFCTNSPSSAPFYFEPSSKDQSLFKFISLPGTLSNAELTSKPGAIFKAESLSGPQFSFTVESPFKIKSLSKLGPPTKMERLSEGESPHEQVSTLKKTPFKEELPPEQIPLPLSPILQSTTTLAPPSAVTSPLAAPDEELPRRNTPTGTNSSTATISPTPNSSESSPKAPTLNPFATPASSKAEAELGLEPPAPIVTEIADALLSLSVDQQEEIADALATLSQREQDVKRQGHAMFESESNLPQRDGNAEGETKYHDREDETLLDPEGWDPEEPTLVDDMIPEALEKVALKIFDELTSDAPVETVSVAVKDLAEPKMLEEEAPLAVGVTALA